jgi:hypothetical protein
MLVTVGMVGKEVILQEAPVMVEMVVTAVPVMVETVAVEVTVE